MMKYTVRTTTLRLIASRVPCSLTSRWRPRWRTRGGTYYAPGQVIAGFLHTGRTPVDPAVTFESIAFMVAARLRGERGGADVSPDEVRKPPVSTRVETIRKKSSP